jgi:hypothetical protein
VNVEPGQEIISFQDKPIVATMISGGITIAVFVFFIVRWSISNLPIPYRELVPYLTSILIIVYSIRRSLIPDTTIQINTSTGWVFTQTKSKYWEGFADEPPTFLVLQRDTINNRAESYTQYKLYLELDDQSFFEVSLHPSKVSHAIQTVDLAKSRRKNPEED